MDEPQIERPDVIVPDTGPLIHLAQTDALHLLHQIGGRVVVADMVAFEATQDMTKPGAQEIQNWLDAGQKPHSNAPVLVAPTEIGRLFAKARTVDPTMRARDSANWRSCSGWETMWITIAMPAFSLSMKTVRFRALSAKRG